MNLVEISETLKGAPDDFLIKHVQNPDGSVPQFMALSELQRRKDMRDRFAAPQPQTTVADDLTGGIAPAAPQMAAPQAGAPQMPQEGIQGYASGGGVGSYIDRVGGFESGNNPNAKNPYSTASGRYQFLDSTRAALDKRYGFDPRDRSAATERARMEAYTNETAAALRKNNLPVSGGTLYGGHLLGQGGITNFLKAYQNNPNAKPSEVFSAEVIRKNPAIFSKARTLADVMEKFDEVGGEDTPHGIKDRKDIAGKRVSDKHMSGILSLLSEDYEPTEGPSALEGVMKMIEGSGDSIAKMGSEQHAKVARSLGIPGYAGPGAGLVVPNGTSLLTPKTVVKDGRRFRYIEQLGQWRDTDGTILNQDGTITQPKPYQDPTPDPVAAGDGILSRAWSRLTNLDDPESVWTAPFNRQSTGTQSGIAAEPYVSPYKTDAEKAAAGYGPRARGNNPMITRPQIPVPQAKPEMPAPEMAPAAVPADPLDGIINDFLAEFKASRTSPEERKQMALLQAGLGMMSGESPWAAVNIGRGGMAGVAAYQDAKKADSQMAEAALNNALKIQAFKGSQEDRQFERDYKTELLQMNRAKVDAYVQKTLATPDGRSLTREQAISYRQFLLKEIDKRTESTGIAPTLNDWMQAHDIAIRLAKGISIDSGAAAEDDEGIDANQ